MNRIIKSLLDNDLYTLSICFLYLMKFSRAIGEYTFIDRNETVYPKGFAEKVQEQVNLMADLCITDNESEFLKRKCNYFPQWFILLLKAYKFDPAEVSVKQDNDGHLMVNIKGYLWRTVFWEVPLLAIISELKHITNGDIEKYSIDNEIIKTFEKGKQLIYNGLYFSDFGTRRRFSFDHHEEVVKTLKDTQICCKKNDGKFVGTSNMYLAMKYDLIPIGTMSHQYVSMIGAIFGYREANYLAMKYWQEVYDGNLGIYLYDTFTWKAFEANFGLLHAKSFDGLRVDSGDNIEELNRIIDKYNSLGLNPKDKTVTFSNGLNVKEAIDLHKMVNNQVKDRYGIGTNLTCDIDGVKPSNMVIKLTSVKITEVSEWRQCVKLSNDISKACGDKNEIELVKRLII